MIIKHNPNKITHPYFNDPTNRWLDNLTNEQHHSLPAISSSAIKCFYKKSPWVFYQKYVLRQTKDIEIKQEFKIGTLIHLAILEPEKFEKTVFVCDESTITNKYKDFRQNIINNFNKFNDVDIIEQFNIEESDVYAEAAKLSEQIQESKKQRIKRNSKNKKQISPEETVIVSPTGLITESILDSVEIDIAPISKDNLELGAKIKNIEICPSKNGGYIVNGEEIFIIKSHEMTMLKRIQENAKNHDKLNLMLNNCKYIEQSGIAQCPKTGLFLSLRGDARSDLGYFIDPKSINDLSIHSMESAQASFCYFLQQAHYLYVANLIEPGKYDRFYFLYISKESPYEICFTHLNDDAISQSNKLYFNILNEIATCEYKQKWPTLDESNGILLKIPKWAF